MSRVGSVVDVTAIAMQMPCFTQGPLQEVRAYLQPVLRGVCRKKFVKGLTMDSISFSKKCRTVIASLETMSDPDVVRMMVGGGVLTVVFQDIPHAISIILADRGTLPAYLQSAAILMLRIVSACLHNVVRCHVDAGALTDVMLSAVKAVFGRPVVHVSSWSSHSTDADIEVWACDIVLCAASRHSQAQRARHLIPLMADAAARAMAVPERLNRGEWSDFARKMGVSMFIEDGKFLTEEPWAPRMMMYATIVCLRQSPPLPQWEMFANRLLALMIDMKAPLDALFYNHICELSERAEQMADSNVAYYLMKIVVLALFVKPGTVPAPLWRTAMSCSRAYLLRDMTGDEVVRTQWVTFVVASYMKHHPKERVGPQLMPLCEKWLRKAVRLTTRDVIWTVSLGYVMDIIGYVLDAGASEDVLPCISMFGTMRKVVSHLRHRGELKAGEAQLMARLLTTERMRRLQSVYSSQHRLMIREILGAGVVRLWKPQGWRTGTTEQLKCLHAMGVADATAAVGEPARWRKLIGQIPRDARHLVLNAFYRVMDAARGSGVEVPLVWLELQRDVQRYAAHPEEESLQVAQVEATEEATAKPRVGTVGCWNPCCRCLDCDTEASMRTRQCGGCCRVARYCSARCQKADWSREHRRVCAMLK